MKKQGTLKITSNSGFTIVELMIATIVFSVILVVITLGVVAFSNQYYKGVNTAATQNTARSAIDAISQAIQFSSATVVETDPAGNTHFCAGGYLFTYSDEALLYDGTNATPGLYMEPMGSNCDAAATLTGGKQLLTKNQRLTEISVTNVRGDMYAIKIGIAFSAGDPTDRSEVLCTTDPGISSGNCSDADDLQSSMMFGKADNLSCRGGAGAPYCATSVLETVVQKRLGT